jgi:hypothetical protein
MYELWKIPLSRYVPARLEDAGGPVLFPRECDAEAYAQCDADRWDAMYPIVPVRVGTA